MTKVCSGSGLAVWDSIASLGRAVVAATPRGAQVLRLSLKTFIQIYAKVSSSNTKHTIVNLYIYRESIYSPTLQNISKPSSAQQTIKSCSNFENCSHNHEHHAVSHSPSYKIQNWKATVFAKTDPNFISLQMSGFVVSLLSHWNALL